jgi:RiboL-PSP-HEPN
VVTATSFEAIANHLYGDLTEIGHNLDFTRTAYKIFSRSGEFLSLAAASPSHRQLLEEFKQQRIEDLNSLYQGLFIQLYASFEWFFRALIGVYVDELCRLFPQYDVLDKRKGQPLACNFYHTGMALQQIFDNRSNTKLDFHQLARNIGTAVPGSTAVTLNSMAFTLFLGILDASAITRALKRIGIQESFWDDIGRDREVQRFFGENRTRHTAKAAREFVDVFITRRNNIAHRGDAIEPINDVDISHAAAFLKLFVGCLIRILSTHCQTG